VILFRKDWAKYPGAIIHANTKNKSFLRYSYILREMGIKNNFFHLALLQPELANVDPFDPDLDNETKFKIIRECKYNIWYFLREVARFPPKGGNEAIPYAANRGNMALTWSFMNHIDFALIMIRQAGKSGSTDQIHSYITHVAGEGNATQILTKDNKLRKANIERIKAIRDQLPSYLHTWTRDDADNTVEVTCKALGNEIQTGVAQKSEDGADNLGRGLTAQVQHIDEAPYIANIHISLPVALASGTAARDLAKAAGGFYGNIFTTTAGKKDTKEGRYIYDLIHEGMYWNEAILDCADINEAIEMIDKNSVGDSIIINGTFSHSQIGKSDEWLRKAILNTKATEDIADRDFFNVWTSGSESSPLSQKLSTVIRASETSPIYTNITPEKYQIRWQIPREDIFRRMQNGQFVMGLDTSNAVGRDGNGIVLIDVKTLEVVMLARISEANILKFAKWISSFMVMFPSVTLVPENKSSGQSIMDIISTDLMAAGYHPFKRIFNRLVGGSEGKAERGWLEIKKNLPCTEEFYVSYKGYLGFMTTGNTRAQLYDSVFQQAAGSAGHLVKDKILIDEILALVTKNGRVDHPSDGHDDTTIAWLLGNWFLRQASHLDNYGLSRLNVLAEVSDEGATVDPEELERVRERNLVRKEIEELKLALEGTNDIIAKTKIEARLSILTNKSQVDGGEPVSLDAVLGEAREKKKSKTTILEKMKRIQQYRNAT